MAKASNIRDEIPVPLIYSQEARLWIPARLNRVRNLLADYWCSELFGVGAIVVASGVGLWWALTPPPPGYSVAVLALLAILVSFRTEITHRERVLWIGVVGLFMFLEFGAIQKDRREHESAEAAARAAEAYNFARITYGLTSQIRQEQQQFSATMEKASNILSLSQRNIEISWGGEGFPVLLPLYPTNEPISHAWPVKVGYFAYQHGKRRNRDLIPLFDVTVEISEIDWGPINEDTVRAFNSFLHPEHYSLGTIVPGMYETPIRLVPGRRYYARISTRRNSYLEKIYIRADPNAPGGYALAWCLYRERDSKSLAGDCKALRWEEPAIRTSQ